MFTRTLLSTVCLISVQAGDQADQQCIPGKHGPPCKIDSDCVEIPQCTRCASSGFCTGAGGGGGGSGCTKSNKSYDFLMLVQGWPMSYCFTSECKGDYQYLDHFVLHGLWPSRIGAQANSYPCECDDRQFDQSQVASIQDDMHKFWPSIKEDGPFWAHEWTKHGTCASDVPQLEKEFGFFNTTLGLYHQFDILAGLSKASIVPDPKKLYTGKEILDALAQIANGNPPTIGCVMSKGVQYLHEIAFCISRSPDLKAGHCDDGLWKVPRDEVSDCDLTVGILLPPAPTPPTTFTVV